MRILVQLSTLPAILNISHLNYEEFGTPLQVRIGNITYLHAKGRGTVNISCPVHGE